MDTNTAQADATVLVTASEERQLIVAVLAAHGAEGEAAGAQADHLVEGDLRGHPSHGLQRLPVLAGRLDRGLIDADSSPELSWRRPAVLAVDGGRGFGPAVASVALAEAVRAASEQGICLATISNASHLGILAPYVEAIAAAGQIGIAATTSEALVHPYGGTRRMIGTNPLAIAVPAEPSPLVLDMATGAVSMGRVLNHAQRGLPLEEGWALDASGQPTTDAVAASKGAIAPFGGAKGYALGLTLEVLVGALTVSALGTDVGGTLDTHSPANKGDLFICIDPAVAGGGDPAGISAYLQAVRASEPAPGRGPVRVPGDRAAAERARRLAEGIELGAATWLAALALRNPAAGAAAGVPGSSDPA